MALSGRYAKGETNLVANVPLVILNVQQPGMLRTLNVYAGGQDATLKIVVDGVTALNTLLTRSFGGTTPIGQGIEMNGGGSSYYVSTWGRMLNLPFAKSLEVTIIPTIGVTGASYSSDYVVDVKETV